MKNNGKKNEILAWLRVHGPATITQISYATDTLTRYVRTVMGAGLYEGSVVIAGQRPSSAVKKGAVVYRAVADYEVVALAVDPQDLDDSMIRFAGGERKVRRPATWEPVRHHPDELIRAFYGTP